MFLPRCRAIQRELENETTNMKIDPSPCVNFKCRSCIFLKRALAAFTAARILLVSVEADGVRGWGECVAGEDPYYSSEWIETAWPTIKDYLAPFLLQGESDAGSDCAGAVCAGARASYGEGRARKRGLGCGGAARSSDRSGNFWVARGRRFLAEFRSAFRILRSNFCRRLKPNWRRDIGGSRSR